MPVFSIGCVCKTRIPPHLKKFMGALPWLVPDALGSLLAPCSRLAPSSQRLVGSAGRYSVACFL